MIPPLPRRLQRRIEETKKNPLPPPPAVGSPAARLASFQEFAVRLPRHLLPPSPHLLSSLAAEVSSLFLGPSECVPSCVRLPCRRDSLARRARAPFRDGVCLPVLSGRLVRRPSTVSTCALVVMMGSEVGGDAILPAVVCMQTTWTVRPVGSSRDGGTKLLTVRMCVCSFQVQHVISFFPSPYVGFGGDVCLSSPSRAL